MNPRQRVDETLWIYTQAGVFRFCSRSRWEGIFSRVVKSGWQMPSAGEIGWLRSELNPYPEGSFFTAADAKSFALAVQHCPWSDASPIDEITASSLSKLSGLFSCGPVFVRSEPPRNTASSGLMEVAYGYSCPVCGFLHHGSWLFSRADTSGEEIRSSVESMLAYTYCPLCGSKEIVSVPLFLAAFDPDRACDFLNWDEPVEPWR
jgi:hypothetical protein